MTAPPTAKREGKELRGTPAQKAPCLRNPQKEDPKETQDDTTGKRGSTPRGEGEATKGAKKLALWPENSRYRPQLVRSDSES